jgi:hypothetical protein
MGWTSGTPVSHAGAELVLDGIITYQLDLLLPPGTITRERGQERSTLDLVLSTPELTSKVVSCRITSDFSGSDHLPIETTIQTTKHLRTKPQARKCWKKLNYEAVQAGAQWLWPPSESLDIRQVDDYVAYLTQFIQALIEQTVPIARTSEHSKPWWTGEVADAILTERRARSGPPSIQLRTGSDYKQLQQQNAS